MMEISQRNAEFEMIPPERDRSPVEIHDRLAEKRRVVVRLEALLLPQVEAAARLKTILGAQDLLAVILALEAEADGLNPDPHLACPDEIRLYLRRTIYDDLLAEPSNILFATPVNAETTRYVAMPREFWKECLAALKSALKLDERA